MGLFKQIIFKFIYFLRLPINFYKKTKVSNTSRVCSNCHLISSKIGKWSYIGPNCILNYTQIGNYCSIAPNVLIGGMEHSYKWISTSTKLSDSCISGNTTKIGNDVWIGTGAIIKQGISIGNGSVVGAGSFVNKDVPENTIVFGTPAKKYKKRFDDNTWSKIKKSNYWSFSPKPAKKVIGELDIKDVFN